MRALFPIAVAILMAWVDQSAAGGFFGKKAPIRGSVGNFLDKHVEKPITTPMARNATVAATTAVGTAVGAYVGAPQTGAAVGGYVGDTANERAAGQSPAIGRPYYSRGSGTQGTKSLTLSNSTGTTYQARVFSRSSNMAWPAGGGSWRIDPGTSYDLTIQCSIGEILCLGTRYAGGGETGVGLDNRNSCSNCCRQCGGAGQYASN
jgi:hypothetical protein